MLTIDGSSGEGGGQILRTALALSIVTGRPFRIENIRAGRENPGLLRQHLTAVKAATEVSDAREDGAALRSKELTFAGPVRAGDFTFSVGTTGSATLVLQTVLPALLTASGRSKLVLEGGTHNPAGDRRIRALVANLPRSIAEREVEVVQRGLSIPAEKASVEELRGGLGPGNVVMVEVDMDHHTEVFTGFGEASVRAETVAEKVVQETRAYVASNLPVSRHLADQLLVPLALAGAGHFRTSPPSRHTTTNVEVVRRFLDVRIDLVEEPKRTWTLSVGSGS